MDHGRSRRYPSTQVRSEEHTSELQSLTNLVCRLLLDPPTTEIYTLSLHDALPISSNSQVAGSGLRSRATPPTTICAPSFPSGTTPEPRSSGCVAPIPTTTENGPRP